MNNKYTLLNKHHLCYFLYASSTKQFIKVHKYFVYICQFLPQTYRNIRNDIKAEMKECRTICWNGKQRNQPPILQLDNRRLKHSSTIGYLVLKIIPINGGKHNQLLRKIHVQILELWEMRINFSSTTEPQKPNQNHLNSGNKIRKYN